MEARRKILPLPKINPSHSDPWPVTLPAKPTQALALHTLKKKKKKHKKKHAGGILSQKDYIIADVRVKLRLEFGKCSTNWMRMRIFSTTPISLHYNHHLQH
jgi:hypothetical protein